MYVRAMTIGIVQDQELLRLEAEVSELRILVEELRMERDRCLGDSEEVD